MKVIVCGAGQVGFHIARYLSAERADVTVIDQSPALIQKVQDSLDVKGLLGHASYPDVLEEAGASDADLLIAVTFADEVNMVACQVAHSLFNLPTKIARIRHRSYLKTKWQDLFSRDHMPIDHIISPEIEVAKAIKRRLTMSGAIDMIPLAEDKVRLIGVHCDETCPIINTPLRQLAALFPDLNIVVIGIQRGVRCITPSPNDQMLAGDEVFFVAETTHASRAMAAFGHEEKDVRRIMILGGGNIGLTLAESLEQEEASITAKVIENERDRAQFVAQSLTRTVVLNGDALDPEILDEGNVGATETVVAVSNDDKVNILSSLLAKQYGAKRAVTLVNETNYAPLIRSLGIDVVVSPRATTVSTILQHVRRGRIRSVHSLGENFGEVIEADALETSHLVGTPLRDINLPEGVIVAAIVRAGTVIIPDGDTIVLVNDRVVIFAAPEMIKKVEKILRVRPEFF